MLARRAMRRRPIARAAVGTAVVAGTAGVVHHHQEERWAGQQAGQQEQYDEAYQQGATDAQTQQAYEQQMAQQQPAAPPPAEGDLTAQLQQLAELHQSGVLSDEEFAAAKAKLLAG